MKKTFIFRMTKFNNHTTRCDELVELVDPDKEELLELLRALLSSGRVSLLVTTSDGYMRFYTHDLCYYLYSRIIGG